MYTKPEFSALSRENIFELIERAMFATVVTNGPDGPVASHLPIILDKTRGAHGTLITHLARANEHSSLILEGLPTLVIFHGPHGYISSSWYPAQPVRDSAPTWNFAVVHAHGRPVLLDEAGLVRHLIQLVDILEKGREKRWQLKELGAGGMGRRLPYIIGFEVPVDRLDAKFKMGQDERLYDTRSAIEALDGIDPELSNLMERSNAHRKS
ncbi:FMN-binding negative transcriptional regulator [Phyllobacterium sp. SB3]|uniref:FMN-binding negative transcriptional regulator n=1 Tax=Phyllobacterium sp. SB3 TaxID=3156073 RepID=UPI0032AE8695